jgi:hypothetical protein
VAFWVDLRPRAITPTRPSSSENIPAPLPLEGHGDFRSPAGLEFPHDGFGERARVFRRSALRSALNRNTKAKRPLIDLGERARGRCACERKHQNAEA